MKRKSFDTGLGIDNHKMIYKKYQDAVVDIFVHWIYSCVVTPYCL